MLNRIFLMGRLARDPELRRTQTGTPVASFRLAVDRDFKDKNTGERATDWIDVVAWRQTAEFVSRYFTKGRMAVVEGRLLWRLQAGRRRRRIRQSRLLLRRLLGRRIWFLRRLFRPRRARGTLRLWRPRGRRPVCRAL